MCPDKCYKWSSAHQEMISMWKSSLIKLLLNHYSASTSCGSPILHTLSDLLVQTLNWVPKGSPGWWSIKSLVPGTQLGTSLLLRLTLKLQLGNITVQMSSSLLPVRIKLPHVATGYMLYFKMGELHHHPTGFYYNGTTISEVSWQGC